MVETYSFCFYFKFKKMSFSVTKTKLKSQRIYFQDIRSYFTPKTHAKDDDSDVIPESPQMQIKNKGKKSRRKRALSDDSDESSPKKKVQKKIPEPEVGKKGQKSKNSTILKEVKSVELFGSGSIKRTEPMLKKTKVTETGIHSDNEFELSLLDLDEMVELESAKTTKESTNEGKNKTIELLENKKNNSLTKTNSRGKKDDHKKSENEIPKQKSKELKQKTVENCSNDDNDKINHINTQMPTDFSEFIESTERKKDDTPRSKKRKLDKSLNESVLTDEEKHERRIMSAALYKSYLNRSGPKNLGSKQMPKGTSNCLKDCAFVLTGVLDSFEKDDIAKAIADFGGSVKQGVTKKVTHVLAGEDPGPAKMAKAQELGIKIINEDEFLQMITDLSDSKKPKDKAQEDSKSRKKRPKKDKSKSPVDNKYKEVKTENVTRVNNKSKSEIKIEYGNQSKELMNIQKSKSEGMAAGKTEMCEDLPAKEDKSQIITTSGGVYDSCLGVFKSDGQTTDTLLWVDKYKPTSLKQIIGQHGPASNVKKLSDWLTKWYASRKAKLPKPNPWAKNDDGGYYKAALLSGPPGVGKTTTVSLVCKELGFDMVEFNASDTRNKTLIKEQIGELLTTTSLSAYARGETGKQAVTKKHVLVMDEVDGMAGNEDRGGLQELISLIKLTSVPIICICNDRNSQKMRSLVNYCYDLRFKRPTVEQIKSAMMSICFKEKIKIPPDVLSQLIIAAGQDVRQTLHLISIWAAEPKLADPESLRKDAKNIKKDIKLGPWDAVRKVFTASEHTNMSMNDKSDLFFYDYSLSPLFVQENYLQVVPHCPKNKVLEKISIAADSISLGDLVESRIRRSQAWNLLPIQAMYSSVLPGNAMAGHMTGQIQFPGWLGKNSRANKMQRLGQEIHAHTRLSTSGSKSSIFLDYCTHLRDAVVNPMLNDRADGIAQSLEVLESYHLLREDLDSLIELSLWPGQRNPMILVDSKVKAAMTRAYNKRASALPYAPGDVRRARAHARDGDAIEDEAEASEPQEDSDPENDALIKKKKLNEDKPALKKEKPSTSKEKKRKK